MNPVSYDMAAYLETNSLGVVAGAVEPTLAATWGIFVNRLPDRPIGCVAVFEAPSPSPVVPLNMTALGTNPYDTCYFQIQVRHSVDKTCWDKVLAVAKALNGLKQYLVLEEGAATVKYSAVLRRSDFLPIEIGVKDRFTRSVNFAAWRQELVVEE